jgi:hypothetical protein
LAFVDGSNFVGLEPHTGKPAWNPIDLGFLPMYGPDVPSGTPAFANLDGDGRIDMVLRRPDKDTVRAVTLPSGKLLWPRDHTLPGRDWEGWVPNDPRPGFLLDPLPVDLDGDGKAEVIVPDKRGTIAVLDGASGQPRWRSTAAINTLAFDHGFSSAARVLVGPDLDGDGCRDLYLANAIGHPSDLSFGGLSTPYPAGMYPMYPLIGGWSSHPLMRVQALSGKTGEALWRCHFPMKRLDPMDRSGSYISVREPLLLWQRGRDGWPRLVVPGNPQTLVVEGGTGRVAHTISGVPGPYRAIDLDGDGIPELIGYQSLRDPGPIGGIGDLFEHGRLHLFRGTDLKAGDPRPVSPQEEPVERVPLPWVRTITPEPPQPGAGAVAMIMLLFSDATLWIDIIRKTYATVLPVPSLLFLTYVGFRVLRKGWRGLWFPVSAYLELVQE